MPVRVGLLGGGTVGGGVCEILRNRASHLSSQGADFKIVKIAVRDVSKKRDFEIPEGCEIVSDHKLIIEDANIDMVVELIGGVTTAKDVILGAIAKGKHVVTGNKALIAAHLPEIQAALKANPKACFGYEAAVCGGIPIISTMRNDYVGDVVDEVMGIMNGTTNFILSKMAAEGAAYADVLAEAQKLGYAETPPDFDVEGWDARSKLAILCKLGFGVFVPEEKIPCYGITRVTTDDFKYADQMKCTVKILGVATRNPDGSISAYVATCMVPLTNQLSGINGVLNCVAVKSQNLATCVYSGPGAGRFPTANSVVNDMVAIAKGGGGGDAFGASADVKLDSEIRGSFYLRFTVKDTVGIIASLGRLAQDCNISIDAIYQTPITDENKVPFVMTTNKTTLTAVNKLCEAFSKEPFCKEKPLVMPYLAH
eukprot:TRINITY_DN84843_c0_g1_i1.p1 TRINITY_DN84843_c0_g1~~TRINITY_DN84843_c0_g1_i1.p1  ORF type:complete len:425 (+),score=100.58 TRINITY_DN84843_c0_g1_i1:118-1392(+)